MRLILSSLIWLTGALIGLIADILNYPLALFVVWFADEKGSSLGDLDIAVCACIWDGRSGKGQKMANTACWCFPSIPGNCLPL